MSAKVKSLLEALAPETVYRLTVQLVLVAHVAPPVTTNTEALITHLCAAFASVNEVLSFLDEEDLMPFLKSSAESSLDPNVRLHLLTLPESAFNHKSWSDLERDSGDGEAHLEPVAVSASRIPVSRVASNPEAVLRGNAKRPVSAVALPALTPKMARTIRYGVALTFVLCPLAYAAFSMQWTESLAAREPPKQAVAKFTDAVPSSAAQDTPTQQVWAAEVSAHIKSAFAKNAIVVSGTSGVAIVDFAVDATGRITNVHLARPSGNAILDQKAMAAVGQAAPVTPPLHPNVTLNVPFQFKG